MAGTRAPFASLAALAAVATAQGEQSGTAAAESAKQDLKSLPAVQRPVEATSGKSVFSGSSAATGLSLGTPASAGSTVKEKADATPGKSANWLLDGVNQLEAEAKLQRDAVDGKKGDEQRQDSSSSARQTAGTTTNPFTEYLTQWLSPADQALLNTANRNAGSSSTAPWEIPRSDFRRETGAASQAVQNPLQMELPGIASLPESRTAKNPYLAETFQIEGAAGAPGPAAGREASADQLSILTPSPSLLPAASPASAPTEQARPAQAAAPTERLIDDRKYFPQLRRF